MMFANKFTHTGMVKLPPDQLTNSDIETMIKQINDQLIEQLIQQAKESPRLRSHHNLHDELDEPVQRLVIALQQGTYVKPHRHTQANKWELMNVLRGSAALLIFDDAGVLLQKHLLGPTQANAIIEMPINTWHMIYPITENAILFEVKQGPYTPATPEDFAPWAPNEGDAEVADFLAKAAVLQVGESLA